MGDLFLDHVVGSYVMLLFLIYFFYNHLVHLIMLQQALKYRFKGKETLNHTSLI